MVQAIDHIGYEDKSVSITFDANLIGTSRTLRGPVILPTRSEISSFLETEAESLGRSI